jgi:hypothetical protein
MFVAISCLALVFAAAAVAGSLPPAGSGSISPYVPNSAAGSWGSQPQPAYQGSVAFNTTGTQGLKNPRVWVACYQSGALVYGAGGSPSTVFKLGGDSSQWVNNGGGAASCTAELYYILNSSGTGEWNGHGAQGGTVDLADTAFNAAA